MLKQTGGFVVRLSSFEPILSPDLLSAMTKNMGSIDRILRTLAALAVAGLYTTGQIGGVTAIVLGAFAVIFLLTSFVGSCPLYLPFGLSTRRKASSQ
jgi:hypothetical protein